MLSANAEPEEKQVQSSAEIRKDILRLIEIIAKRIANNLINPASEQTISKRRNEIPRSSQ